MELLKQRILAEGRNLGQGILKVDGFLNHQVDPQLLFAVGAYLAEPFKGLGVNKVLTAEISGITPAVMTALSLGVPVIYARKNKPITMPPEVYRETAPSHTKGKLVELLVSPEYLTPHDNVLIVDDFLATGNTIAGLLRIAQQAEAPVIGVAAVIEKAFEGGRAQLEGLGLRVHAAAIIAQMTDQDIIFA